jgi:ABC-2 type transport system permease protein
VWVIASAIVDAVLGVGLGLLCSAFARTEFQAVEFMPLVHSAAAAAGRHHRPGER